MDRIGRCWRGEQLALAIPDNKSTVEAQVRLDALAGITPPTGPGRQLQDRRADPTVVAQRRTSFQNRREGSRCPRYQWRRATPFGSAGRMAANRHTSRSKATVALPSFRLTPLELASSRV